MSVTSSTDIANLALDLLSAGTVQDIENPSNATEELFARSYDLTRRKVLRMHPWNFATKRAQLAAASTTPEFGLDKEYQLPADFIRLLSITDENLQNDYPVGSRAFKVEGDKIRTESEFFSSSVLNIIYIYDVTIVSQFDPLFIDLFVAELALANSFKITEGNADVQRLAELVKEKRNQALAADGQESPPVVVERSRNRHVRRNNYSTDRSDRIIF